MNDTSDVLLFIIGLIIILGIAMYGFESYISSLEDVRVINKDVEDKTFMGEIIDFEVSAGGFGHRDICKVVTNKTIVVCEGRDVCKDLEKGKLLYKSGDGCIIKGG